MNETDVVIIGAGHNGLTCAAYLGDGRAEGEGGRAPRGGRRRGGDGGIPSRVSAIRSRPTPSACSIRRSSRDLELHEHGLRIVERRAQNFLPAADGRYLLTGEGRTQAVDREAQRRATPSAYDAFSARARSHRRRAARPSCCARRRTSSRASASGAIREAFNALGTGKHPAQACRWSSSARCSTCSRDRPATMLDEMLRERSDQGAVRLRRHRRQLREPLHAGLGLCAAAPCLRRGERQEGRLGPRHRRHGRDHAGDGEGGARPWRRDRDRRRRARGDRRDGPRGRRRPRRRPQPSAPETSSPTSIRNCCTRGWCRRTRCRRHFLDRIKNWRNRLRHLPHECRAVRPALLHRAARANGDHLTAGIIIAPSLAYMDRAYQDARKSRLEPRADRRDADPLDARRHARARRASMSPACSASTSRRNCPTADPGTTIATRSPT